MITKSARLVPRTLSSSFAMAVVLCSAILSSLLCLASAQSDNCGTSTIPFIRRSHITQGEIPWLAVLYRLDEAEKWTHLCNGALISNRFVLTAAHCLSSDRELIKPEKIKVGLGKIYRDFYHNEDSSTTATVSKVLVPDRFLGPATNYAMDVGLLKLSTAVELSDHILPACIDLENTTRVSNGTTVHVPGWGISVNGTTNNRASEVDMTYLDHQGCVNQTEVVYRKYITHDKMCSLSINGSHVIERGDAGGAVTFIKNGRHFVVGVVSTKITHLINFAINTDLSAPEVKSWLKEGLGNSQ